MELKIRYLGGKKFEATARGHQVLVDQPLDDDGKDSAMTPPELFLSSLGSCAAYYATEYLKTRQIPAEGLEIRISALKGEKPARIVSIQLDVIAAGLEPRHRDGVLRAVEACLLKRTIDNAPTFDLRVESPELVEA